MPEVRETAAFKAEKNRFVSQHGENAIIISTIKRLLRKLGETEIPQSKKIGFVTEFTHLEVREYALLAISFVVNPKTGEVAPFRLFFPGIEAKIPVDETDTATILKAVLDELGWD